MHNNYYFSISEFLRTITSGGWHQVEAKNNEHLDQIFEYHFKPQNKMRADVGKPMRITSCFRPELWERKQGRDGTSQHCFPDHRYNDGIGASDVEPWNSEDNDVDTFLKMGNSLIGSSYARSCFYPLSGFFHNDYKAKHDQRFIMGYEYDEEKEIYVSTSWQYIENHDEWEDRIRESWKEVRGV